MAENLARAQGRHVGLQTYLKAVTNEVTEYISAGHCEQSKLLGFKKTVLQLIEQYGTVHETILSLLEPDKIGPEVIKHMQSLEQTYQVLAQVDLELEKFQLNQYHTNTVSSGGTSGHRPSNSQIHRKLPKIGLPQFSGNPLEWQGFWDQFQVSVHENVSISEIDKFNYLKGCLKGEAHTTVSGLTLSSENYKDAIDILRDRFGNEQVLISAHMESLLKIDKIRSVSNVKGLRTLYTHVENCIRNLRALKLDTSGYGSLLIPILKDRLPDEINMIISRQFCGQIWSLDKVMEYFGNELKAQENCNPQNVHSDAPKRREPYTTSGLFSQNSKMQCFYCNGDHFASRCGKVTNRQTRKAILRKSGRCFICLDTGHLAKQCRSRYECKRCRKGKHHISICETNPTETNSEENNGTENFVGHTGSENKGILLQTAIAFVCASDKTEVKNYTRILFDSGSQRSYISDKVRSRLQLKTLRKEKVIIKTFGQSGDSQVQELDVVQVNVKDKSDHKFTSIEALCVPSICSPLTNQHIDSAQRIEEFKNLEFADRNEKFSDLPVGILIGIDFYHTFMTGKIIRSREGPVACGTKLGWVLSGRLGSSSPDLHCFETHLLRTTADTVPTDALRNDLDKFWAVESIGLEKDQVVSDFRNNIMHDGTRYVTKLPFKPDHEPLADNFAVSEARLKSLKARLLSKGIVNDYDNIFKEYEQQGIIERIPSDDVAGKVGQVHYLPHRPVIRDDKETTKIRAVFDASCKTNSGPSLNECLYAGPNLITKIFDILLRFRLNRIGILADIRQAFLNVAISPEHRTFLRFLWYDIDSDEQIIYQFSRVVFGLTSSPFLLNATIKHHLSKYINHNEIAVETLQDDLYVDDLVSGRNNLEEAKDLYNRIVYLRFISDEGVKVCFFASKTKVAPLKALSIPRLELLGCLLLSKLIREVLEGVKSRIELDSIHCWSDSEVALCWIRGKEKCWKPWVENRVVSIRSVVDRDRWHFVKGDVNPADIPTRISVTLNECFTGRWFSGPSFLLSQHFESGGEDISTDGTNENPLDQANREAARVTLVSEITCNTNTTRKNTSDNLCSLNTVIDCTKYSSLKKLIVVTGYVRRYVNNVRKRAKQLTDVIVEEFLTVDEYESALSLWIKAEQRLIREQSNYGNLRGSLNLFEDKDGLLRLKGRFANSRLKYEEQFPVLLRSDSHLTKLIIWDAHESTMHHGVESTLARVRKTYWIIKGRKSVKDVLRKCVVCKRYQGKVLCNPASPDLPAFRVDHSGFAFQATGLDYAGPLYIKNNSDSNKVHILLLTCASSRAIHLELTMDMSIEGFLRGFKRFIARRGVPEMVINDNFKTFKSREVKRFMVRQGIKQRYILPASPWWGGFYERLVRTVKTCLKKTLGRAYTTFEELQTILCDIEVAINNPPLAYLSEDDLEEPLTPFHLMYGRAYTKENLGRRTADVVPGFDVGQCRDRFQHLQKVLRDCWVRFRNEYLNELRQMNMHLPQNEGFHS
ncbi:uncharacterized protein LOC114526129 [Dendronephthya gigantea]|uniref:uncharacterized protein LOC114526129 n=1 Tax=Dendronephthya gigantea TaxID=151771 RepID=UPI00106C2B55|nr:uncharacterized protein LOC114526129 [Dendronephthya gigantea]